MRLFLLASVLIWSLAHSGYSQDVSDSLDTGLEKGSWSLQFQIYQPVIIFNGQSFFLSGGSILNEFEGGFISAKYHLSDHSAIRGSIGFTRLDQYLRWRSFVEAQDVDTGDIDRGGGSTRDDFDIWTADASIIYLRYMKPAPSVAFYVGGGPGFMMDLDDTFRGRSGTPVNNNDLSNSSFSSVIDDVWGTGLHVVVGAEWFVTRAISLIAEYHSQLFYKEFDFIFERGFEDRTRFTWSRRSESIEGIFFESQPVRFGLSVYF